MMQTHLPVEKGKQKNAAQNKGIRCVAKKKVTRVLMRLKFFLSKNIASKE